MPNAMGVFSMLGSGRNGWFACVFLAPLLVATVLAGVCNAQRSTPDDFVDLSLLVAPEYPCTWPSGFPRFQIRHYVRIGRGSVYNSDILTIDGNTSTQLDVPPHSIPRPGTDLPNEGPLGLQFTDKTPAWRFVGEACVIDIRELLDIAAPGVSSLVQRHHIEAWETAHRELGSGDIALLWSGYSDKYYQPLPAGRRFIAEPLEKKAPGWPDPDPEAMEYMAAKGVTAIGTDSPSMGPIPDLSEPTHYAGLKYGAVFTEGATGLGQLPPTGAFYFASGPRHALGPYGECRAFAVKPGPLASWLNTAARQKNVVDLSVVLSTEFPVSWPGFGVGNHRHPYTKADFLYSPTLDLYHHTHMMDSHTGTHLVPPSYALPEPGFRPRDYSARVRGWLRDFERDFGRRGHSQVTTEQVPLSQTCGWARVIDVRELVGSTSHDTWPRSPQITRDRVRRYELENGVLQPGEVVLFQTGHTDRTFRPAPDNTGCISDPINGVSEGWPSPGADVIKYLAARGIGCVGTDAPTLGGVEERNAAMTYWALGSEGMVAVEFLIGLDQLPGKAYFIFAPVKIRDCHGGPGRAIALFQE
jgi:kynurenine formamidase